MTPAERLEAAIARLEQLKAESTPGDWGVETIPETGESRVSSERDGFAFMAATTVTSFPVPGGVTRVDAQLIVTLHRTIDAQLGILRDALHVYGNPIPAFIGHEEQVLHWQLALADAVLGGTE